MYSNQENSHNRVYCYRLKAKSDMQIMATIECQLCPWFPPTYFILICDQNLVHNNAPYIRISRQFSPDYGH